MGFRMPVLLVVCDLSLVAVLHLAVGCGLVQDALSVSLLLVSQCSMLRIRDWLDF